MDFLTIAERFGIPAALAVALLWMHYKVLGKIASRQVQMLTLIKVMIGLKHFDDVEDDDDAVDR